MLAATPVAATTAGTARSSAAAGGTATVAPDSAGTSTPMARTVTTDTTMNRPAGDVSHECSGTEAACKLRRHRRLLLEITQQLVRLAVLFEELLDLISQQLLGGKDTQLMPRVTRCPRSLRISHRC